MWSYFEARDLVKELGVDGNFKRWWNLDGNSDVAHIFVEIVDGIQSGGTGYGATTTMGEASGMAANRANAEGQIDGNNGSEQPEGYSSDDSVRGVHFDDSEEERTVGLDDGFDVARDMKVVKMMEMWVMEEEEEMNLCKLSLGVVKAAGMMTDLCFGIL
ncbi:hypothetical protein SESBI_20966 [Sesbania bispinosa]|nr:hypothetical protein SESBI_20966 [Sesbania bispinosa]